MSVMNAPQPVLVLNAGSSSIKYRLFDMRRLDLLAKGLLERVGSGTDPGSLLRQQWRAPTGDWQSRDYRKPVSDHAEGLALISQALTDSTLINDGQTLYGIGHRVVHGGDTFRQPTLIDADIIAGIEANIPLAPLHNPANLLGIRVTLQHLPEVPQVAVFDTAFHHSLPPRAYRYALPEVLYSEHRVRRYGFHGTSHGYVSRQAAERLKRPLSELKLISLHLGNGASAAAIDGGRSIDTSMGMTPLEGLVMGTRSGDLDPAIPFYLARQGYEPDQIETLLNHDSGLQGIAGDSDMRGIIERATANDPAAQLALDLFCYRIRKYLGAYTAALGGLDAIIFTGGIGEHAAEVRRRVCADLNVLGIDLDSHKNSSANGEAAELQSEESRVAILLIPTNEELEIALQTVTAIDQRKN